jgi:hypothetical protein
MALRIQDGIALFAFIFISYKLYLKSKRTYPPGPKGLPFFGNLYDHPQEEPWVHYKEMSEKFSALNGFLVLFRG